MQTNYGRTLRAGCLGYITQATVNNYAPLLFVVFRDTFGIPLERMTVLITVNFIVQFTVDILAVKLADRIGYRKCIVAAHILDAAGLIGLAVLPFVFKNALAGLLLSVTLYAAGGGLIEVLVSPIIEYCPLKGKSRVMSLLHSFYCWGSVGVILISTLFLYAFGRDSWRVLACIWAALPLFNSVYFGRAPIVPPPASDGGEQGVKRLFGSGMFWVFAALMTAAGASELSMSQWASAFAEAGLGISKTVGDLAGPCLFAALMGCARLFYAVCGKRIDLLNFIIGSSVMCFVSYLVASLSPLPFISLAACAVCGLSVGILWPGILSMSSAAYKNGGTAMFAVLALAGDAGCCVGPSAVGIASAVGGDFKKGILCAAAFPALLIICALVCKKSKRGEQSEK